MSTFHEQLIEARRRGEAPGQSGYYEPADSSPQSITFSPVEANPVVCDTCGSAVPLDRVEAHIGWHRRHGD